MYIYKGGKDVIGIPGVPARDLTDDEAEEYGVTDHALYERVTPAAIKRRAASGEERTDGSDRQG
jgi:hypothetical protein